MNAIIVWITITLPDKPMVFTILQNLHHVRGLYLKMPFTQTFLPPSSSITTITVSLSTLPLHAELGPKR